MVIELKVCGSFELPLAVRECVLPSWLLAAVNGSLADVSLSSFLFSSLTIIALVSGRGEIGFFTISTGDEAGVCALILKTPFVG